MKIVNLIEESEIEYIENGFIYDKQGSFTLGKGIIGVPGVRGSPADMDTEAQLGIDKITMQPQTAFPQHTHPGGHIIYVLEGQGSITMGGETYHTFPGNCYFVPANIPHSVAAVEKHVILAIGYPHKEIQDPERMEEV